MVFKKNWPQSHSCTYSLSFVRNLPTQLPISLKKSFVYGPFSYSRSIAPQIFRAGICQQGRKKMQHPASNRVFSSGGLRICHAGFCARSAKFSTLASSALIWNSLFVSNFQRRLFLLRLRVFIRTPKLGFCVYLLFFLRLGITVSASRGNARFAVICPFDLSHLPAECVHIIIV